MTLMNLSLSWKWKISNLSTLINFFVLEKIFVYYWNAKRESTQYYKANNVSCWWLLCQGRVVGCTNWLVRQALKRQHLKLYWLILFRSYQLPCTNTKLRNGQIRYSRSTIKWWNGVTQFQSWTLCYKPDVPTKQSSISINTRKENVSQY